MQQLLAYGMMALVIAALCLVYFWKNRSTHAMGDRFGLLFLEARDYAAGREDLLPRVMTDASGLRRLLPMEEQPEAVRNAFLLGGSGEMARYDA